jgi:hypothetical protein
MSSRVARVERRRFGGDEGTRSCASSRALATRRGVVATLCRGGARARGPFVTSMLQDGFY